MNAKEPTSNIESLLEIIDNHLAHHKKQYQTNYVRGYIKGVEWTKTEIMKERSTPTRSCTSRTSRRKKNNES